ncbi:mRNA export factor GLE1-like [Silene latifolia]|uniref:mRNA export factor GLE1-like n=1 Tax=Silene latifolia TaxID=37657 RepID=UPI003D7893D0
MAEIAFLEMTYQHNLRVTEELRNQVNSLTAELIAEKEKYTSAILREVKAIEAIREYEVKLDIHYQRKIAETLDNHLIVIRKDYEEKFRQLKMKEEDVARRESAIIAEEMKKAAAEAERAKNAAAETERAKEAAAEAERAREAAAEIERAKKAAAEAERVKEAAAEAERAKEAENALMFDEELLRGIARLIRQISGSVENVRSKTREISRMLNNSDVPQSVTIAIFAKKVISLYETRKSDSDVFACGRVIVNVSGQVPAVMSSVLAEFHKECMYTVPNHITYSKAAFETEQKYFKAIGFREKNGKLETMDEYLERLESWMKLYGAFIQTEGHGLEYGWTWLARFLNTLPVNVFTASALTAFLEMAGFALHEKYKDQFRKVLTAISKEFVQKLKASRNQRINPVVMRLEDYIKSNKFLVEPEGMRLRISLSSNNAYL